jgi:D-alanyl-D-alanine carboxypeptidase
MNWPSISFRNRALAIREVRLNWLAAKLLMGFFAVFQTTALSPELVEKMKGVSWHQGCPVAPSELRMLTLSYWDFDGHEQTGRLIVNAAVTPEVTEIFRELYAKKFPIERMQPVEEYGGNDDRSMEANNTSAFNCRDVTGQPGKFSNHSWGRAIDLNPLTNPYVKGAKVLPEAGRAYLDRSRNYKGGIVSGGLVVELFKKHGWDWGGDWKDRQDYQHFEKPSR